ncbi:uncharacterized protein LOC111261878 isoform X2 [Varroa jacobsoni]|uniref:Transmembrane protein n=1 Tax=Varroa destructor TaxID=109461 RepID=A0A7M7KMG1_VARDE|nr:uncharacterized protein LOC111253232 [Varroa destructor]XP_022691450.1 uncharacterized protein LOC111261878 isoform X2 [Varroa jacobsoni]
MINPDRYQEVKLYREDDAGAIDPLKVAYSIIIEGCIDILFSFILYYSVKYERSTLVLLWLYWQFVNTLFTFIIASVQVIAAVFASSTYALVGVMASWMTVFLMVYCMKCVGSYYYELTLAECDEGNAETTASLMEDAWKNQQACQAQHSAGSHTVSCTASGVGRSGSGVGTSGVASACSALASRVHSACSMASPSTSQISLHALHMLDQPSCSRVASACSCACAAVALAMTPPPHRPSHASISVQTDTADNQIAIANV